ncbi:hypothetical protein N8I77_011993 [Diaporthe amygdali]|uniref:Rhodopsin domain-containing protein n=1 Tax=Phomopsis amygdali TaxID=1214568 RepID=A0AAD9S3U0_PHOAM|nr:uncharacterized protein J7T55_002672 [Diaporthe amygdali]KAJ0122160.1 hypothetical protein J7T55_002672 [Diaporthe amygdali]KAK2598595.1 hypothetical protein N8I77_011993 [Diaporthe amygdali]
MENASAVTNVLVWFLFLTNFFSVCARLGTRYFVSKELEWDDGLQILAQVTSLGQGICISIAASHGLGQSQNALTQDDLDTLAKANYASLPLLILTLALIKWSISIFITRLTPNQTHLYVDLGLRILNGLWWLSATLISLFQCTVPRVWDLVRRDHCIDQRAWWTYVAVINILTEVGTVGLLVWIIGMLQISTSNRVLILIVFMTRTLVIAAAAAQLGVYWNACDSEDVTSSFWLPTILNQVVICTSVVTSCLPFLKPLMLSLESGIARVPDEPPQELAFMGSSSGAYSGKSGGSAR